GTDRLSFPFSPATRRVFLPTHRRAERPDLVDDVVSTIDVKRFSGDEPSGIVREKCRRRADIIDADETTSRSFALGLFDQLVEFRNAGSSARRERARRDRVNPDALWAQFSSHVAHGTLQRGFGPPHDVVVFYTHLAAVVAHREQRPAILHQRLGEMSHANE